MFLRIGTDTSGSGFYLVLIQIHHQQLILMTVISRYFVLMINGWPVRVCTAPYWMVGGWFVHYGVSVLMCAVFGDFYRMPNLELWVFPFLAHYLGPVSLASLANKCFAASWPILFL